jgi:hypothetical protein
VGHCAELLVLARPFLDKIFAVFLLVGVGVVDLLHEVVGPGTTLVGAGFLVRAKGFDVEHGSLRSTLFGGEVVECAAFGVVLGRVRAAFGLELGEVQV